MNINLAELIGVISGRDWEWTAESVTRILGNQGWSRQAPVLHRIPFVDADGHCASLYLDGNNLPALEVVLESSANPSLLSPIEYEELVDSYYGKFEQSVSEVSEILGTPAFNDGSASNEFPSDQDALWLALWNLGKFRLMIQQKHEGREIPFRLCLVVAPHPEPK